MINDLLVFLTRHQYETPESENARDGLGKGSDATGHCLALIRKQVSVALRRWHHHRWVQEQVGRKHLPCVHQYSYITTQPMVMSLITHPTS